MYLRNIIYGIWEEVESYGITDDSPLTYPLIKDKVISVNNTIIKDTWRKKLPIDMCYSIDPSVEVTCFKDSVVVGGITFTSRRPMYKATLPAFVPEIDWDDISYFGMQGLAGGMTRRTLYGYMASEGNVWTADYPIYTIIGNEAIMKNLPTKGFTLATLVSIREDPTTISTWDSNDEQDFPTPSLLKLQMLTKIEILKSLGRPDLITDAQRQLSQQPQRQEQVQQEAND